MFIGLGYQDHGVSDEDVWTFSSYYRISDERGDRKRKKLLYSLVVGGKLKNKMQPKS